MFNNLWFLFRKTRNYNDVTRSYFVYVPRLVLFIGITNRPINILSVFVRTFCHISVHCLNARASHHHYIIIIIIFIIDYKYRYTCTTLHSHTHTRFWLNFLDGNITRFSLRSTDNTILKLINSTLT